MNLQEEILSDMLLNNNELSRILIKSLPKEFAAYSFRNGKEYGVYIEWNQEKEVSESFSGVELYSSLVRSETETMHSLIISCSIKNIEEKFSYICANFVDPHNRRQILSDPYSWWQEWKALLGNINRNYKAYSVLGEMVATDHLLLCGENPKWEGERSVVDIVGDNSDYEVKSSVVRNSFTIEVSGMYQMENRNKDLTLIYCVFEKSSGGFSIDEMVNVLEKHGIGRIEIEKKLTQIGIPSGRAVRSEKYHLVEMRKYPVREDFPKITKYSFKDNVIPAGIIRINYTLDLASLRYETIDYQPL